MGKVALYDGKKLLYHGMNLMLLRPKQNLIYPQFLFFLLASTKGRQYARRECKSAINQASLSQREIGDFEFSIPPLSEQINIINVLSLQGDSISQALQLIAKLKQVKQGLLHDLLTRGVDANGEIRPRYEDAPHLYQESELGWIPKDWSVSVIGTEFDIQLGKMLDSEKNSGVLKPYIGNKAVQWDNIAVDDLQVMAMTDSDLARFRLVKGDLLVCEGGVVGRSAIWDAPINECYYQKALHRLRPRNNYNPNLMAAFLQYWADGDMLANYTSQTSIAHLTQEKLAIVPLPKPSITEQSAIVTILAGNKMRMVEESQTLVKLKILKAGLMDDLLTGRVRVTPLLAKEGKST